MRLHGEDHDVVRSRRGVILRYVDGRNGLLAAVGHHQPNTARAQGLEIGAARDEGHVLAGEREPRSQVAANRTDSDDRYLQWIRPPSAGGLQLPRFDPTANSP